jgi:peptide/nickel transport system permease protein
LGRDLLSRIIFGGRISLLISILAISFSTFLGISIGLTVGYFGGRIDTYVMRGIDALLAFPDFILALALTASLGFGMHNMVIAIGVAYTPNFCRLVRGSVLVIKEQQYVEAAKSIGAKSIRIMFSEILPNCLGPVIVQATMALGFAILMEAGLSFLGIGIQPPISSWGSILADGREHLSIGPWITTFTGIAITITVLGINLVGDGLRDALDPKLRAEIK